MNNQFGRGPFATPPITMNLIIANFVVWLACTILPIGDTIREYSMLYWVGSDKFHAYQFITYMFVHADFQHLFFNMFSLWMFGRTLEQDLGPKKFLIYYFTCGIGAALLQMGVVAIEASAMGLSTTQLANYVMLGASGATMGVVMSFGVMHPNAMVMLMFPPIPMKAKWLVVMFIVIEFVTGVRGVNDSVAHFAHLGGMLWGWLLLRYWKRTHQIYY